MLLDPRMKSTRAVLAVLAAGVACLPGAAAAERVEIPSGRDATLFSMCGCYADGAGTALYAGQTRFYGSRRALLWFGIADSIPSDSRIDSVQVRLRVEQVASGLESHALHRVTGGWEEGPTASSGGGGAPAAPGDVTWTHTVYPSVEWSTPGGDFVALSSAVAAIGDVGEARWSSTPGLVADVQAWLDEPASNLGWILIGNEAATQTAKRFASGESTTLAFRPSVIVDYTPPVGIDSRSWAAIKRLYAQPGPEVRP